MPCPEAKSLPVRKMIQEGDIDSGPLGLRPMPWVSRRAATRRRRKILLVIALLFIVALSIDGLLITMVLTHPSHASRQSDDFPFLTLTSDTASLGEVVLLHLNHFTPTAPVLLTRDAQSSLRTDGPFSIGASGNATVRILVEGNWGIGTHLIAAEDTRTRYTASVALQVIGSGPVLPPQLLLSQPQLDMGADWSGANTLRALDLRNNGGGTISWTAKSNQSWLQLTPAQGVFSAHQMITIAVTRAYMRPGSYQGILSIVSNTDVPAFLQVKMSVRALPPSHTPLLTVTPPVLAFSALDGAREPLAQAVTISNPGLVSLAWSTTNSALTTAINQNIPFQVANWLKATPASGILAPHTVTIIHIQINTRLLFPGAYAGLLKISGQNALDTPQGVAISLNVQQHCGIATDAGVVSFTATANQQAAGNQNINLHTTAGCATAVAWSAFTMADWLSVTPANGEVQNKSGGVATIGVAGKLLHTGTFWGFVVFLTEHRTQTIAVQLTVLPSSAANGVKFSGQSSEPAVPSGRNSNSSSGKNGNQPSRSATQIGSTSPPLLSVSPSQLTYTVPQGIANGGAQQLMLANSGGSALLWQASINNSATSWLTLTTTQGTMEAGQTLKLSFATNTYNLSTGIYKAQINVRAMDGSGTTVAGSPQVIPITLHVVQPCLVQVSPTTLSFSSSLLQPDPGDQTINLRVTGTCSLPISWQANSGSSDWLALTPLSGSESGAGSSINVHVDTAGKILGSYSEQITFSAQDNTGASVNISTASVSVTLDVLG